MSKIQLSKRTQSEEYLTDTSAITDFIDPRKILPKIANKPEDLSKKVTLNDIIKTVDTS